MAPQLHQAAGIQCEAVTMCRATQQLRGQQSEAGQVADQHLSLDSCSRRSTSADTLSLGLSPTIGATLARGNPIECMISALCCARSLPLWWIAVGGYRWRAAKLAIVVI